MRVDTLAVRLRPRTPLEASDLGVRMCQSAAGAVFRCHAVVVLPLAAVALACHEIAGWLPCLIVWWAKPWIDRTSLFVLSRAAFGHDTVVSDLWRAGGRVLTGQLLHTVTERRCSPWRSFTQPVYQLEGSSPWQARGRAVQLLRRTRGQAVLTTVAFSVAEMALVAGLLSLIFWLSPFQRAPELNELLAGEIQGGVTLAVSVAYIAAVLFLEPFYVASGFAMYLNRRADLEAWDIEQEFRRAFAR